MDEVSDLPLLAALLRKDFCAFVEKVFHTIAPGDRYLPNWHIEAIAHALSRCRAGEITRLLITQPPRSLKSICASVAFPAWALGHDPTLRFICVSYSQDLALELARQFRQVMESDWYRVLFPGLTLAKDAGAESVTTAGGSRLATSIGGTLTGRGADCIIIDDPMKAEDAASELARRKVLQWYQGTLATRLDDKGAGVIIVAMQRLHEDDLAGHVQQNGVWHHLDLPAIAIEHERVEIGQGRLHSRRPGALLHPERESKEVLDRLKAEIGSLRFSAQYQQRPIPAEGNIVRREWLKTYETSPTGNGVRIVQSWDAATSTGAANDYSVCVTAAVQKGKFYIVDVWRGRLTYPDLKRKIITAACAHGTNQVLIERAGPGIPLVQEFAGEQHIGMPRPIGITPDGDKVMRLEAITPVIERGDLLLPAEAPWLAEFMGELLGFPNTRHDDQVDALSQLIAWHAARERNAPLVGIFAPIILRG